MQFTIQEINQLLEALRIWESEPNASGLQSSMLGIMLSGPDTNRVERERQMTSTMEKAKRESDVRRDQSIMIQAKLIQLRNELAQQEFLNPSHA